MSAALLRSPADRPRRCQTPFWGPVTLMAGDDTESGAMPPGASPRFPVPDSLGGCYCYVLGPWSVPSAFDCIWFPTLLWEEKFLCRK